MGAFKKPHPIEESRIISTGRPQLKPLSDRAWKTALLGDAAALLLAQSDQRLFFFFLTIFFFLFFFPLPKCLGKFPHFGCVHCSGSPHPGLSLQLGLKGKGGRQQSCARKAAPWITAEMKCSCKEKKQITRKFCLITYCLKLFCILHLSLLAGVDVFLLMMRT